MFISQTIESVSGPHPEAESGFTLFCDVVVPALTWPPQAGFDSLRPLQRKRRAHREARWGGP